MDLVEIVYSMFLFSKKEDPPLVSAATTEVPKTEAPKPLAPEQNPNYEKPHQGARWLFSYDEPKRFIWCTAQEYFDLWTLTKKQYYEYVAVDSSQSQFTPLLNRIVSEFKPGYPDFGEDRSGWQNNQRAFREYLLNNGFSIRGEFIYSLTEVDTMQAWTKILEAANMLNARGTLTYPIQGVWIPVPPPHIASISNIEKCFLSKPYQVVIEKTKAE
jgi:hypothetical protein